MSWKHYTTVYLAKHVGFPPCRILVLPLLLLEKALDGLQKDPQSPEERQTWWHGESRRNSVLSVWCWAVGLLGLSRAQTCLPENEYGCPSCRPTWPMAHVLSVVMTLWVGWRWRLMGEEKGRNSGGRGNTIRQVPGTAFVRWPWALHTTCAV